MMTLGSLGFLSPWILAAGLVLPVIWWLLRITPPRPDHVFFPATRLLVGISRKQEDRAHSPWWLTLLRLLAAATLILALARPVLNPLDTSTDKSDLLIMVIDNGWASAGNWTRRHDTALQWLERAEQANRPVIMVTTAAPDERASLNPVSAFKAREQLAGLVPLPFAPDRMKTLEIIRKIPLEQKTARLIWLSDGLDHGQAAAFATGLAKIAGGSKNLTVITNPAHAPAPLVLRAGINKKGQLQAVVHSPGGISFEGRITALDAKGRPVLQKPFKLLADQKNTRADFDLPLELRNQITRIEIEGQRSAGSVFLVDGRANWQRIGLLSGEAAEEAQPLLSPLYYVKKALVPYGEITTTEDRNTAKGARTLLSRDISVLILAGIGRLEASTTEQVRDWLNRGGIVIRFAGPRLEQGADELLPAPLREGGRALGGALSWSKPQKLAKFEQDSPFFGLPVPDDVSIRRQVLVDPSQLDDASLIWARLADGTPLVTARKTGRGLLVLFHVTANSTWSDLPHSGLFVDMLRRLVDLAGGVAKKNHNAEKDSPSPTRTTPQTGAKSERNDNLPTLPPLRVLNGFGEAGPPSVHAEPVKMADFASYVPSLRHPPGLYGTIGRSRALNIGTKEPALAPLPPFDKGVAIRTFQSGGATPLAPFFLTLALVLFLIDGLVIALMRGLSTPRARSGAPAKAGIAMLALCTGLVLAAPPPAFAASGTDSGKKPLTASERDYALKMSLETRLAYVRTGDPEIDRISHLGLAALSKAIARRTAFEPAAPVGVDISKDELAFFPLLYWAVPQNPQSLDSATLARINAYMKQGGVILFDTRDQISNFMPQIGRADKTPLSRLLSRLDIPPLEPVPHDHVLTRSFYLLDSFPGRYAGGTLWVEALGPTASASGRATARSADGVSSLLITSNNLAAAWATDEKGRTLFAVTPDGERQREMAYRTGINIVMYALTGNYKADQVHLPALMRRLGQ